MKEGRKMKEGSGRKEGRQAGRKDGRTEGRIATVSSCTNFPYAA
jgi:hypothetical protein